MMQRVSRWFYIIKGAALGIVLALATHSTLAENRDLSPVELKQDEERIGGIGGTGLYRSKVNPAPEIERLERPERIERPEKPELDNDFKFNSPDLRPKDALERPEKEK